MLEYIVKPQTLIVLVGPSNSGKSLFARMLKFKIKSDFLQSKINIVVSDKIRSMLIDQDEFDKMADWMFESSTPAFDVYYYTIESCMKFPAENDIIIADATNLSMDNINKLTDIADKYRYSVDYIVFYYKNVDEYFRYCDKFTNKEVTFRHYKRLHRVYKELLQYARKNNQKVYCIRQHVNDVELSYNSLWNTYFAKQFYEHPKRVLVVGDIHGQYTSMIELLGKYDIVVNGDKELEFKSDKVELLVFVGDYIDKCPYYNNVWMINFVAKNIGKDNVIFLRGNHERFVYNYLHRQKPYLQTDREIINKYFTGIKDLLNDGQTRNIFFDWYPKTLKFVKLPNCIVCHAPTDRELLCKLNCDNMIKGDLHYQAEPQEYVKYFNMINSHEPIVVVGHKSTLYPFMRHNLVFIDCGVDKGNMLCGCFISKKKDVSFKKVIVQSGVIEDVPNFHVIVNKHSHKQRKISFGELDNYDLKRIRYLHKHDIKFISGTMPPAWANDNSIEDINSVFDYYKRNNINEVILEPKYMGSRINVYLDCENIDNTKFVTRQGFIARLNNDYRTILLKQCKTWIDKYKMKYQQLPKTIVIDGELLPWQVLGQDLIENSFNLYSKLIQHELDILKETGFDTLYEQKYNELKDLFSMDKKDLINTHGHHVYRMCKLLNNFTYISIQRRQEYIDLFNKQLELYANPDLPVEIKSFSILQIDNKVLPIETNVECFTLFNDDDYFVVDVTDKQSRLNGIEFFKTLSYDKGYEGVVVKPNKISDAIFNNVVPYFKVRNEDYLLIIYGYLYKEFYNEFVKSKNRTLGRKIQACIQEWNAGLKMLQAKSKTDLVNAFLEFKYGENIELETDPRL